MEWLTHFQANYLELGAGFVAGNALWFSRQWLWQQWVKKSHGKIQELNRIEEEKTRAEVRALRQQVGHLSLAMMEQIYLPATAKEELKSIIDPDIVKQKAGDNS